MKERIIRNNPIVGSTYGSWTVISERLKRNTARLICWNVKCSCGHETFRSAYHLVTGKTKACSSCKGIQSYKDTFKLSYFNKIKSRACKINVDFDLDYEYLYSLIAIQDFKCSLSNLPISFRNQWTGKINQTASLDRIDNSKGYIKGNVQWVHKDINMMKHVLTQERFIELCKCVCNTKCA